MTKSNLLEKNIEYERIIQELKIHKIEVEMQNHELRCARERLEAAEQDYADLYDYSPVGYLSIGEDDRILRANLTICLLLNAAKERIIGSRLADYINAQDQDIYYFYRKENNPVCDVRLKISDGTLWVRLESRKRHSLGVKYLTIMSDISSYKRIEDAKIEFTANMNHELRNPLNAIIGMTDLTLMTELTDDQKMYLNHVKNAGKTLLSQVDSMLTLSKITSGKLEDAAYIRFHPEDMFATLAELYKGLINGRPIVFETLIDTDIPAKCSGDPERLLQVLTNLLSNALKFTTEGKITFQVDVVNKTLNGCALCFTVSDTGIGISTENQKKLFRNFSQVDSSITRRYGGSGLGLCISQRLVDSMGGNIVC
ncbi:MAG: PAS domain-containing sensor histidine kinase, partial [Deltaproteobacteria bacterium]